MIDVVWYSELGGDDDYWVVVLLIVLFLLFELELELEFELEFELELLLLLILDNKDLFYLCYYLVLFFKLISCYVENDVIIDVLNELCNNVKVDVDCELVKDLLYVLNVYVYVGNGIGCRFVYDGDVIVVKKEVVFSYVYVNLNM